MLSSPDRKQCFKCHEVKPLVEFYRHQMMADGRLNKCKSCTKNDVNEHRLANLDKIRAYDRARAKNPERAKAAAEISAAWRKADSRRTRAHSMVSRAIRAGTLCRGPCERCSRVDAFGHHESYDKPLEVTWLCQPCHRQRHKEMVLAGLEP